MRVPVLPGLVLVPVWVLVLPVLPGLLLVLLPGLVLVRCGSWCWWRSGVSPTRRKQLSTNNDC